MSQRSRIGTSNSSQFSASYHNDGQEVDDHIFMDNDCDEDNTDRMVGVQLQQAPAVVPIAPPTIANENSNLHGEQEAAFHNILTLTEHFHLQHQQLHNPHINQEQCTHWCDGQIQMQTQSPEPDLLTLVQSYDWPRSLHRLRHYSSEATSVGVEGRTPLHIACDQDAPVFVIRALLMADDLSSDEPNSAAIKMVGTSNMNPLHIACTSPHASACVVSELLLRSRPDLPIYLRNAIVKQITEMKDVDGDMPLHVACRCGAPIEVLVLMLEANPNVVWERDYEGLTPLLRLWVRYFVTLGEGVISRVSGEEDLVGELGHAWEKTLLLLIASYYGTIMIGRSGEEDSGFKDSSVAEERSYSTLISAHKCRLCEPSDGWPCGYLPMYMPTFDRPLITPPPVISIKSATVLDNEDEDVPNKLLSTKLTTTANTPIITTEQQLQPFLVIHAATKIDCPRAVVKIATKLYPDQLNKPDSSGYTPLALAAQAPIFREHDLSDEGYCIEDQIHGDGVPPNGCSIDDLAAKDNGQHHHQQAQCQQQQHKQQRSYETASPSVIQILLDASPEVAAHPHPKTGRIPLHFAVLSGKSWYAGVYPILEAYPNGIMVVDSVTGLYPFMLAATVGSERNGGGDHDKHSGHVNTNEQNAIFRCDGRCDGAILKQADLTTIFLLLVRKPDSLLWLSKS